MLRLQDGKIIYNNSEDLGTIENMNFIKSGFSITLSNGSVTFIPEQDCTSSEKEVFQAYHEYYKNTEGVKPQEGIKLEQAKSNKIKELDTACTNAILAGFEYTKDGTTYLMGFDTQDQSNITQQIAIISVSTEPILWKVKGELIFLQFTKNEFLQMGLVAKAHKETNIQKFYSLCGQVSECTTVEEVDAIVW